MARNVIYDFRSWPDYADGVHAPDPDGSLEPTLDERLAAMDRIDFDGDGLSNLRDNAPGSANPDQADLDADGIGDVIDTVDDRPSVSLAVTPASFSEAGSQATVTATLSAPFGRDVTVTLSFGGTAIRDTDYAASASSIVIQAGTTSAAITLVGNDDGDKESDESIVVDIATVSEILVGTPAQISATVTDNDTFPGSLQFSAATFGVGEAAGTASIRVTPTGGSDGAVSAEFVITGGTAALGSDYTLASASLNFAAGQTEQDVVLNIINDTSVDGNETVTFELTNLTGGASLGAQSTGTLTITDDDAPTFTPEIVTGAGAGGGPHVRIVDAVTGALRLQFFAYDAAFAGGVRLATGDINGDGTSDIITAPGAGGGPHVRVFDGLTRQMLPGLVGSFYAYDSTFSGGVSIASGDLNGDGRDDIITGAGAVVSRRSKPSAAWTARSCSASWLTMRPLPAASRWPWATSTATEGST